MTEMLSSNFFSLALARAKGTNSSAPPSQPHLAPTHTPLLFGAGLYLSWGLRRALAFKPWVCLVLVLPLCCSCASSPASCSWRDSAAQVLWSCCHWCAKVVPCKALFVLVPVFGCKGTTAGFWCFPVIIILTIPFFMPWLKTSVVGKIYCAWSEYWEVFKGFMPRGGAESLVGKCVIVIFTTIQLWEVQPIGSP